jgi:hypothetical protein
MPQFSPAAGRSLLLIALAALCLLGAGTASASTHRPERPMRVLCQLARVPARDPGSVRAITGLCTDRRLLAKPQASAANVVYGNCGSSFIYDTKLGTGWVSEYFGVTSNGAHGAIAYGSAIVNWYNFTHPQYRNSFGPLAIYPGWIWDETHHVYSHSGLIGSWLDAADVMDDGAVCSNALHEPNSYVRV